MQFYADRVKPDTKILMDGNPKLKPNPIKNISLTETRPKPD